MSLILDPMKIYDPDVKERNLTEDSYMGILPVNQPGSE